MNATAGPLLCVLLALVFNAAPVAAQQATAVRLLPLSDGPPGQRSTPFIAWYEDLSAAGYRELEFLVSGQADIYDYAHPAGPSAAVASLQSAMPYTSRLLVRRPDQAKAFNGTVYLELLNATAGWDGDPIWQGAHHYLLRTGAAWVGISGKPATVDFLRDSWGKAPYPARNAQRYRTLSMPHFSQIWDMLGQAGRLVRTPGAEPHPLAGLQVERVILVGYSQSADYLVTFANSFHARHRLPDGRPVFDGYYVSGGHHQAKHVRGPEAETGEQLPVQDPRNWVRTDAPVIRFQTQTEVIGFDAHRARQTEADFPRLRFYEMAGGAHVDAALNAVGGQALARDLGLPPSFCPEPEHAYNPIRVGDLQAALLHALERWIRDEYPPPPSRLLELDPAAGPARLLLDADGNAVGGVRPAELRAPLGTYLASNRGPGFCDLFGGFIPFDTASLEARYPGPGAWQAQMRKAVDATVAEGFLLPADAARLRQQAAGSGH